MRSGAQNLSDMDASAVSWQKLHGAQDCRPKSVMCPSAGQVYRFSEVALPAQGQGWSFPTWWRMIWLSKYNISRITAGPASLREISISPCQVLGRSAQGQPVLWRADHLIKSREADRLLSLAHSQSSASSKQSPRSPSPALLSMCFLQGSAAFNQCEMSSPALLSNFTFTSRSHFSTWGFQFFLPSKSCYASHGIDIT